MAYYKEIVTKAVIGKGKKATKEEYTITPSEKPDEVLGCWITNHKFNGAMSGMDTIINGSFDINVWYSYDNNQKTGVVSNNYTYKNKMNVNVNDNALVTKDREVIVECLSDPSVLDVKIDGDNILFTTKKEMGIEIVGDTKIKVNAEESYDDYDEILDDNIIDDAINDIDLEVEENYINEENSTNEEE